MPFTFYFLRVRMMGLGMAYAFHIFFSTSTCMYDACFFTLNYSFYMAYAFQFSHFIFRTCLCTMAHGIAFHNQFWVWFFCASNMTSTHTTHVNIFGSLWYIIKADSSGLTPQIHYYIAVSSTHFFGGGGGGGVCFFVVFHHGTCSDSSWCTSLALPDPHRQPVTAYSMNGDNGLAMRDYDVQGLSQYS